MDLGPVISTESYSLHSNTQVSVRVKHRVRHSIWGQDLWAPSSSASTQQMRAYDPKGPNTMAYEGHAPHLININKSSRMVVTSTLFSGNRLISTYKDAHKPAETLPTQTPHTEGLECSVLQGTLLWYNLSVCVCRYADYILKWLFLYVGIIDILRFLCF